MVTVMKLEKAPQETYADIGGLDQQIQEIKVSIYFLDLEYEQISNGSQMCTGSFFHELRSDGYYYSLVCLYDDVKQVTMSLMKVSDG